MNLMSSVAREKIAWLVSRGGLIILETKIETDVLIEKDRMVANVNRHGAVQWNRARPEHFLVAAKKYG